MARMHKWIGFALVGLSLTGCVSQEKFNAMKISRDQLAEQEAKAEADQQAAQRETDALRNQVALMGGSDQSRTALTANQTQQIAQLSAENATLKQQLENLANRPPQIVQVGGSAPLPQPLSNALSEFASQNSDIVDFDAARGVVKFKSDVTFPPGSTQVNEKAKQVLQRFSQILDSQAAVGYELMVTGHTDNTPVVHEATIKQGNYDNWYLSAHRAIAVAAELVKNGVNKQRLGISGYADQRPIASNATAAGKAQNRRVEILILPTTVHSSLASDAHEASHKVTPKHDHEMNKDSSGNDRPVLNK